MKLFFRESLIVLVFFSTSLIFSQNLLNTSTWVPGTGNIVDFNMYGISNANVREFGQNHIGEDIVLWKAIPVEGTNADGGIYSYYKSIDHTKTYRLAIWIKKTNSADGKTYFGCFSRVGSAHHTLNVGSNPTSPTNPYFWSGDLPKLDRWYLLVSYVHSSDYTSSVNLGKMYDGVTGEVVQGVYDFKFSTSATNLMLRSFLYNDPNVNDRQYLYNPRIELIDGDETTILDLLRINPDSKLYFSYDVSGNQTQRFYCPDTCPIPTAPNKTAPGEETKENEIVEVKDIENNLEELLKVYPNPTKGVVQIEMESDLFSKVEYVKVYNTNSALIQELRFKNANQKLSVDLTGKPIGVYFVHIHLNDGSKSITKKIVKE